jgi:hypothetical protein
VTDPSDQIKRIVDSVAPVTAAEARSVADTASPAGDVDPESSTRRVLIAVAAILAVVALAGLAFWRFDSPGEESVAVVGPVPTVLPPVGDDPVVSCDPLEGEQFRLSAWSNPTGAELADDPAAAALRRHLLVQAMAEENGVGTFTPSTSTFRRLSESSDHVLFGRGDFDLAAIESDDLGPALSFSHVELVDGTWRYAGTSGGTCNELWVWPPHGQAIGNWAIASDDLPSGEATELTLTVYPPAFCSSAITEEDIVGPDVVETVDAVTIRVVLDVPAPNRDQIGECTLDPNFQADPVVISVPLSAPLGDRAVFDANHYPASRVNLNPLPESDTPSEPPRLALPGGTIEVDVIVLAPCAPTDPPECVMVPVHDAAVRVTADDNATSGATDSLGRLVAVVAAGYVEIDVEAEGLDCPLNGREVASSNEPSFSVQCTRTELPSGRVSGTVVGGVRRIVEFRAGRTTTSTVTDPEGHFEIVLEPGTWEAQVVSLDGVITCTTGPVRTVDVVADRTQALDLTCS